METADPVSYDFSAAFTHRRPMDTPLNQSFPYYQTPYSLPYQAPGSLPYSYAHPVGHTHGHSSPYPYFVPSQHIQQPLRLTTEQSPQSLPEIRPAKNAINQTPKSPDSACVQTPTRGHNSPDEPPKEKDSSADIAFSTNVDVLMKAIQSKHAAASPQQSLPPLQQHLAPSAPPGYPLSYPAPSPPRYYISTESQLSRSGKKRKYTCTLPGCGKSFAQKTHLDIHIRAHTGDKPFICTVDGCGQRFSQQGNLKTHQRRHTGEKPFQCEQCHKSFAQRGNVRAHMLTHTAGRKFSCLLDDCGKHFTQLGNLKSHQNKFHAGTLRNLTVRFSQIGENGPANPADRALFEYFADLYKNSNKGIKGRGKYRCVKKDGSSRDSMERVSVESDVSVKMRKGSYDMSVYGSSTDGDEEVYYIDRRHGHGHGH